MHLVTLSLALIALPLLLIAPRAEALPLSNSTVYEEDASTTSFAASSFAKRGLPKSHRHGEWHGIRPWAIYHGRPIQS
ncbi:hypothetical protein OH77DRAFT_1419143 [Trametes cingulata]|nr:hypothetical protein OH77DRAFT_1419143 [Trametes cingulata]